MSGRARGAIVGGILWFASVLAPPLAFAAPPLSAPAVPQARGAEPETPPVPICPGDGPGGRVGPLLPVPLEGAWSPLDIAGRSGHGAVIDPARHRLIVFGGRNHLGSRADVWELTLDPPARWHRLEASGDELPAMDRMSMVLDPERDHVIVYGGRDSVARDSCDQAICRTFGAVWALDLDRKLRWSELRPAGAGPAARSGHVAIYDPRRDRMIVFGGESVPDGACPCGTAPVRLHDAWALQLHGRLRWVPIATKGAPPVLSARGSAFYDGVLDRMVYVSSGDTLFSLSLGVDPTWTAQATHDFFVAGSPTLEGRVRVAYDPARDVLFRFTAMFTWRLALHGDITWQFMGGPPPWYSSIFMHTWDLADFSLTFDSRTSSLVLFGGQMSTVALPRRKAATLTTGEAPTWSLLGSTEPTDLFSPQLILDPSGRQLLVGMGRNGRMPVWSLEARGASGWSEIGPEPAPPSLSPRLRNEEGLIADPGRNRLVMFGGIAFSPVGDCPYLCPGALNDVWAFDLGDHPRWYPISPVGEGPSRRGAAITIYDRERDRMVVVGGRSYQANIGADSVWALSFSDVPRWSLIHAGGPSPQYTQATWGAYDTARGRVLLISWSWPRPELWALELREPLHWVNLGPTALPPSLLLYDAAHDEVLDLVPGPLPPSVGGMEIWSRNLVTGAERREVGSVSPTADLPPSRLEFAAAYDAMNESLAMYGGYYTGIDDAHAFAMTDRLADTWFLDLDTQARRQDARPEAAGALAGPSPSALAIRGARFDAAAGTMRAAIFGPGGSPMRVVLYDLAGRRMAGVEFQAVTGLWQEIALPLGAARPGIYFLRVSQDDRIATARAVVIR